LKRRKANKKGPIQDFFIIHLFYLPNRGGKIDIGRENGNITDLWTWVGVEKWERNENGRQGIPLHQKFTPF
jgi:hypothetical protein